MYILLSKYLHIYKYLQIVFDNFWKQLLHFSLYIFKHANL